ncbi:hypothetical protein Ahy_B07g086362 [Arachis hypogaea]|uniref:Protein FAR1-RELATED SEQUENCE n=1 Tax=Arachis hypogaea TaxID=3818 RepID=A0A444Y9S1_ARAHY|nr:hypothetical protein Ahy_B07g086362 [Arachis hypogaea]
MESNLVELVCHAPASFADDNTTHSSDNLLNSCDVEGEKSNKLLDHSCLVKDKILRVGMRFEHLKLVQDFYTTYAKKVGFVSKIRNTNFDGMTKEPINQFIHCNWEGFHGSRVKAPTQKNTIAAVGCRARIYAKFDKEKQDWVMLKVDLRHLHPCSTKKAMHYHENRELTIHTKCVIEVNDEAGIRPNETFLALANEAFEDGWAEFIDEFNLHHNTWLSDLFEDRRMWVPIFFKGQFWAAMRSMQRSESMHALFGGYLHCKTSLVQFIHEFDNVFRNKEQKELEDDAADSRGVIPCAIS